jgi:hypothetical protein
MNINTVFNAISLSSIYSSYGPPQQRDKESRRLRKYRSWLLRHDEKQVAEIAELKALVADAKLNALLDQAEIARLQKQLSTERSILDNAPVWAGLANTPLDTVIGIRFEQIIKWQDEIARLRSQLAMAKKTFGELKKYRDNNTVNFQLEKLDDHIRNVQKELEADE